MTSDPRKLSEGDRLRAYHDAINAYIAMYGAGGDDDGREDFSKSQDAMFVPAEFRGRVYALKVNPMLFRRRYVSVCVLFLFNLRSCSVTTNTFWSFTKPQLFYSSWM